MADHDHGQQADDDPQDEFLHVCRSGVAVLKRLGISAWSDQITGFGIPAQNISRAWRL